MSGGRLAARAARAGSMALAIVGLAGLAATPIPLLAQEDAMPSHTVNGIGLDAEVSGALEQAYGEIPDGDYWYDPLTGLWGVAGGPSIGRIMPGLALGGPLRPDASGGGSGTLTGVFVNGREIHPDEFLALSAVFGQVAPGRYWLGPNLVGGVEGYPASFDLMAAAAAAQGGGGAGYNRSTVFGGLMSDGQCSGYLHPGGATVMTGNC